VAEGVIFDFGGVIGISPSTFVDGMAERFATTAAVVVEAVFGAHHDEPGHPWHAAERGEFDLDSAEFDRAMGERFAARGAGWDHCYFVDWITTSRVAPCEPMVALARDLRAGGVRTGLLTNSIREFRAVIDATVDVAATFDAEVDSCAVGIRKPDPAIYRLMLERLGVAPERCLFLDDIATNVAAAEVLGMATMHVTDPAVAADEARARVGR
jgi:putative hydrolase of the HAD superfamily